MIKISKLTLVCLLLNYQAQCQQNLFGLQASEKYKGASEVYINNWFGVPSYVSFQSPLQTGVDEFIKTLPEKLKLGDNISFIKYREDADDRGMIHYRYYQYYKNIYVEGSMLIVHTRNGKIESFNGEYYPINLISTESLLTAETCLNSILDSKTTYAWDVIEEQNLLKEIKNDPNATWFPKGELVICPTNGELQNAIFKLAWKFDVYSIIPHDRSYFFIDATTGKLINSQKIMCEINVKGKAITKYAGTQTIMVDSLGPTSFRMRETTRGGGVDTYDNTSGTDFTDNNNIWDSTTSIRQKVAGDVHFGSEKTFDYYKIFHNRNSFDNNNAKMIGILQGNFVNAFWNGTYSAYGMGSGTWGPVSGIDVVGHEYTHGVTQKSSNLVYSGEPGALNESFSDIFGKLTEWFGLPSKFTWYIGGYGAGSNKGFRNMANPNEFGCPDSYGGKFWNAGDIVHYNSSVQNFWFYLLCKGGKGTNDSNNTYYVDSIGFLNAAKVAYRNNTYYLTTNSKFADSRFYSIKSAQDIFGDCTREIEAVTNAWRAVSVGKGYTSPAGKPKGTTIEPYNKIYCSADSTINLDLKNPYNYGGIKYLWKFGDGDSSKLQNPTHLYKKYGVYKTILRSEYCFKFYYDTTTITLSQKPITDFLINNVNQCLGKNNYKFTSTSYSKLKRKVTLSWDSNPQFIGGKDSIINAKFDVATIYDIRLIAKDDRGCMNEITKQIEVLPASNFNFTFKNSCPGQGVNFVSSNLPDTAKIKYTLLWDLAEGNSATTEKVTKVYNKAGTYKISLSTQSANPTCMDTVSKTLIIYNSPGSDFTYDSICPGVGAMFRKIKTNDTLNYFEWDFGYYKPSDLDSVKNTFDKAGQYSVSLKAVNKKCISTTTKIVTVNPSPVSLFTGHDVCENEIQKFVNLSYLAKGIIKKYEWDFGDITSSGIFEPNKTFAKFGNYQIKLSVTDQRGCKSSSNMQVKVNALPTVEFAVADVCDGQNIAAINTSSLKEVGLLNFNWFVNSIDKGTSQHLNLPAPSVGIYNIKLDVKSDKGCLVSEQKKVEVKPLPNPSYTGFGKLYCINEIAILQPLVPGGFWFINGLSIIPPYTFNAIGNYTLKYIIEKNGCKDSSAQSTEVIEAPQLELGPEQRYCEQKEIALNAFKTNTTSWLWNTGETNPSIIVNKTGNYKVILNHRCNTLKDSVSITFFGDECPSFMPNAFSPNEDGINDLFEIKGRLYSEMELTVYNRLFQIVYQYKGAQKGWDGILSNGEKIGLGIYPCRIKLTGFNGEIQVEDFALSVVR